MRRARRFALIEATWNQVNQDGGYTGMTPADFRDFVRGIAERVGLPRERIVLGGDHLGPNAWQALPAAAGDGKSRGDGRATMSRAGFRKIHLDCSMACAGRSGAAARARPSPSARRASVPGGRSGPCRAPEAEPPVYVIGTEVPVPGGAAEDLDELAVTTPRGRAGDDRQCTRDLSPSTASRTPGRA